MKLIKEIKSAQAEGLKPNDRSIVKSIRNTMIIGLPLTTVMSGVLAVGFAIALDGCSSKEKQPVQTSSSYSQSTQPMVALAQPTPVASPTPEVVAKKKPVVRKPSTVIFADKKNGISFRYPGKFTLVTGEKAKNDAALEEPLPMNFVQPGGVNVTSLALPGAATSSMFDVRINKNLTADECSKFAEPGVSDTGSDLRDWFACGCEPPAGESEPKLGQESERSNPCYSVKRPDESGSRRSCPRGEFVERPFVRWIAQQCDHCLRRGTFAQQAK